MWEKKEGFDSILTAVWEKKEGFDRFFDRKSLVGFKSQNLYMKKNKNVEIIKEFKRKKPFHLATPYLLTFTSASLFTKRFMVKVSEILGDAKEFNKKKKYYRDLVQQELEELYNVETVWKNLVKRSQHSSRIVEELYPAGTQQFAD